MPRPRRFLDRPDWRRGGGPAPGGRTPSRCATLGIVGEAQILAIEGVTGTGKSTTAVALAKRFDAKHLCLPASFRNLRRAVDLDRSRSALTRLLYYLAATAHMAEEVDAGGTFIFDRWLPSVLGLIEATGALSRDQLVAVSEPVARRLPQPELTVVLVADPPVIRTRLATQEKGPLHHTEVHRLAADDDAFRRRWHDAIEHWSAHLGPAHLIDTSAMAPAEVVAAVAALWVTGRRDRNPDR